MLKDLLLGLGRSNLLVSLAVDAKETLVREARAGVVAVGVAGFGMGMLVESGVATASLPCSPVVIGGLVLGGALTVGGAIRAHLARKRLLELKNIVTSQAARDAAAKAAAAGAELASSAGTALAEALGRFVSRTDKGEPKH